MMKIRVSKKQGRFLIDTIERWSQHAVIEEDLKQKLLETVEVRNFDWKRLAKYSFWISIVCVLISLGAVVADEWIVDLLEAFFSSSYIGLCGIFAAGAAGLYYWAFKRRSAFPYKVFSNEFIVVFGVLSTAVSIAYLGKAVDTGSGHFSLLFLLATAVYGAVGLYFSSQLVWIFAVLSLGAWFGTETGYVSGWGAYYLGMNFPLRFVLFGAALTGLSFAFARHSWLQMFQKSTFKLGLLYLFIALWILSIFGNYGDMDVWMDASQTQLLGWGVLFGAAALAAIIYGLKYDDYTSRSFGITFLFINLYTKYFEYFWDVAHKAIFFMVLAATFWFVGRNAEKLWNLDFLSKKEA